jgi:hypothetical protein
MCDLCKTGRATLTDFNHGYLEGAAASEKKARAKIAEVFASKEWKMVARHSPLCRPEIEQLRKMISCVVDGPP